MILTGLAAPDYSFRDAMNVRKAVAFTHRNFVYDGPSRPLSQSVRALKSPLYLFEGRRDYVAPTVCAARLFDEITAPSKVWIWFDRSAHFPFLEEPDKFHQELLAVASANPEQCNRVFTALNKNVPVSWGVRVAIGGATPTGSSDCVTCHPTNNRIRPQRTFSNGCKLFDFAEENGGFGDTVLARVLEDHHSTAHHAPAQAELEFAMHRFARYFCETLLFTANSMMPRCFDLSTSRLARTPFQVPASGNSGNWVSEMVLSRPGLPHSPPASAELPGTWRVALEASDPGRKS